MKRHAPDLIITTAPFLREGSSTPELMRQVLLATIPVVAAGTWFFGFGALLVIFTATVGAVAAEWFLSGNRSGLGTLADGSALLTGILLGLTLPPPIPLWMAFLGGAVAIALGKVIWGGLGHNIFNPALVGRAFLQAAFPEPMTTWSAPVSSWFSSSSPYVAVDPRTFALPLMRVKTDVITAATPLGLAKFQGKGTDLWSLFFGNTGGSIGETCAVLLILCGLWLASRRALEWRLPVAALSSVFVFSSTLHLIDSTRYPGPLFMLLSGGILFGSVFMVTDPVTTPITRTGAWVFGAGLGFLVVLIRIFGGLPEAVMFSILLMNAVTPLINRATQPRTFGY
ncbi:MAG: RnfABCDGE type electron transport complex subunit D [Candidatus Schekmanbacteria bacterium]|nr:RnfABCDGE type electron transport complex subunit D [Candidatus Schekmanbacteria bacterium]